MTRKALTRFGGCGSSDEDAQLRLLRCLCLALLVSGCQLAGNGDGFVVGALEIVSCREGEGLSGDYDLGADFFVGDPLIDASDSPALRRNSVVVRIQETSNTIELADSLLFQFHDVRAAARRFARREPIAITDCFEQGGCGSGDFLLRAQLSLHTACPDGGNVLRASSRETAAGGTALECPRVAKQPTLPECPELDDSDRQRLDAACSSDFNDRASAGGIVDVLGRGRVSDPQRFAGGACLYLCHFGSAERGAPEEATEGFEIDYGDRIAALFFVNLIDARSAQIDACATTMGQIWGMFDFELVRSRAAQAFP